MNLGIIRRYYIDKWVTMIEKRKNKKVKEEVKE